ncbi:MAG: DUF6491 family protein [Novosphingobium sp.]|nr:hypothetical protein [Novosphingobium sp.]
MKYSALLLPLAAIAMVSSPVAATESQPRQEASIPFADHGGIWDWRASGDQAVYFQDGHRRWYRAELFAPAYDLPYVEFIGIDARPGGTLDKWGAVYVHGQRYAFKSFEKVDGPPAKGHHKS